jgi:phosphopentomutase
MPDAKDYNDEGSNTLGSILAACPDIQIPNLASLSLLETLSDSDRPSTVTEPTPRAAYGRLPLASAGKDTITGHWEIAGLITKTAFQTFERFPDDFIAAFETAIGVGTLGNYAASGIEIIEELGPEHERTGKPIVYTSLDSVFQIAANTAVIPIERLYEICEIARALLVGPLLVGRVIARPYVLENGVRRRTFERRDFALKPPAPTLLDAVQEAGMEVIAIGKTEDVFKGQGITKAIHTTDNADGCTQTLAALRAMQSKCNHGLIFTNLVDFDSHYGHRRDVVGYAQALEQFDAFLPQLLTALGPCDLLVLTADHGNDPTFAGYNHTREYVPVLYYGEGIVACDLGTGDSLADISATVAAALGI